MLAGGAKYTKTVARGDKIGSVPVYFGFYSGSNQANGTGRESANYVSLYLNPTSKENLFHCNSWYAFHNEVDESILKSEVDRAAELGYSAFIIDSGWLDGPGDWNPNPSKFPSGMGAFADYVHRRGMKFGLWMPFDKMPKTSKVYKEHPEWQRGVGANPYHLNYALPEVQQWIKDTFTQKIADYKLAWIKTDWKPFGLVAGDPDAEYEQVKGFYPHPIPDRAAARHPLAFSNVIKIREVRWHQN